MRYKLTSNIDLKGEDFVDWRIKVEKENIRELQHERKQALLDIRFVKEEIAILLKEKEKYQDSKK